MPEVKITPMARKDIKGIAQYTLKTWGEKKREVYLSTLEEVMNELPKSRRSDDDFGFIRPNLLSRRCQKHRIFFWRDDLDNIEVLRILHQSMAFDRHL